MKNTRRLHGYFAFFESLLLQSLLLELSHNIYCRNWTRSAQLNLASNIQLFPSPLFHFAHKSRISHFSANLSPPNRVPYSADGRWNGPNRNNCRSCNWQPRSVGLPSTHCWGQIDDKDLIFNGKQPQRIPPLLCSRRIQLGTVIYLICGGSPSVCVKILKRIGLITLVWIM